MATTEQLLKLSPRGAIVRMVNDANGTFFNGDTIGPLVVSQPLDVGGLRTEVELSIRRSLSGDDKLPFAGQLAFRFNRLDVAATLSGVLAGFRPPMPTSTQVLLDELSGRTGIKFDLDDFVLEDIYASNASPYTLKAKQESLRWIGQLEVVLIDLLDLSAYVAGGLAGGPYNLRFATQAVNTEDNQPYLNVTAHRAELNAIVLENPVVTSAHPLVSFLQKTVPTLGSFLRDGASPWQVNSSPGAYNLRGAQLVSRGESVVNLNPLVPAANKVARVRLSSLDTTYGDKDLLIPYATPDFNTSLFNDVPRLKAMAVINASDGTDWNVWLNSLAVPSVITSLPVGLGLRFSGPDEWIANPAQPGPTNLFNAVVQYNGQRRTYDMPPFFDRCNRVIVMTMSDANTAYQGNVSFHYRAPIMLADALPNATVTEPYDFNLNPSEGVGPYTTQIIAGGLAPDHVLTADHRIVGPTTLNGTFNVTIGVTDTRGITVPYKYRYIAQIGQLTIQGTPPVTPVGMPLNFAFALGGGSGIYVNPQVTAGTLPSGLSLNIEGATLEILGTTTVSGDFLITFSVESTDGQIATIETTVRISP